MTREEVNRIFETDDNGRFIRLIVPPLYGHSELNAVGKTRLDLTLEEIVLIKKYAAYLYGQTE